MEKQLIPVGYKQTEVGVIPEDWELFRFEDFFSIYAGGDAPRDSLSEIKTDNHPYPIFANAIQNKGLYGYTSYKRSKPDSITITARGYIGHAEYRDEWYFPIVRLLVLEPKSELSSKFIAYAINDRIEFPIESTGVPQLTAPQVGKFAVAAPNNLEEQTAIANALSDVDALIAALEKLIDKKSAIKTAAMQQLLTGKKRLPPFDQLNTGYKQTELGEIPGDWEVDKIGEVLSITTGGRNTQDKISDGLYPFYVRSQTVERINSYSFDGEGILTAGDGVGTGKIFHYINGKCDIHQRVYLMYNFSSKLHGYYFYIYFKNNFYDKVMSMTAKSSVDSVRREMIADMLIALPSVEEQTAIATVLSDMDKDLESLQQRLHKTQQIKQGMMQELLTGKTRLIK